jgi:hypothetical protein
MCISSSLPGPYDLRHPALAPSALLLLSLLWNSDEIRSSIQLARRSPCLSRSADSFSLSKDRLLPPPVQTVFDPFCRSMPLRFEAFLIPASLSPSQTLTSFAILSRRQMCFVRHAFLPVRPMLVQRLQVNVTSTVHTLPSSIPPDLSVRCFTIDTCRSTVSGPSWRASCVTVRGSRVVGLGGQPIRRASAKVISWRT